MNGMGAQQCMMWLWSLYLWHWHGVLHHKFFGYLYLYLGPLVVCSLSYIITQPCVWCAHHLLHVSLSLSCARMLGVAGPSIYLLPIKLPDTNVANTLLGYHSNTWLPGVIANQ